MTIEDINNKIQAENDSYYRDLNRLQQKTLDLKKRHLRTIKNLKSQKEQTISQNKHEQLKYQSESSENIFKSFNQALNKFV